jgi:transglutaminase-like putative cysteine protease
MPAFSIRHVTTYRYASRVSFGEHVMMLRPREGYDQRVIEAHLAITPEPAKVKWISDVFGNTVALARFATRANELRFESNVRVHHSPQNAPDFSIDEKALTYPFDYPADEQPDLTPWIAIGEEERSLEVARFVRRFVQDQRPIVTGHLLMTLTTAIKESFAYVRRPEPGTQTPGETLALRSGTCRDFAVLMIAAARHLGLAARFVSGYLYVPSRDRETRGGGSTHAWCQVYLPGSGWVDFDPTNGIVGNRDLIRVAVGRQPRHAVPLSGSYEGSAAEYKGMTVEVVVSRLTEGLADADIEQNETREPGAHHENQSRLSDCL